MKRVTMHEAKTHLSRLVDLALAGEEVIIARRDQPVVRLTAIPEPAKQRQTGCLPGLLKAMGDDFNEPVEDWNESLFPAPPPPKASTRRSGAKRR